MYKVEETLPAAFDLHILKCILHEIIIKFELCKVFIILSQAYPSLKPLASWVTDLVERMKFIHNWIDCGIPSVSLPVHLNTIVCGNIGG